MEILKKIWNVFKIISIKIAQFLKYLWLAIWSKIKTPKTIWLILFYIFFILLIGTTLTLVIVSKQQYFWHYILYALSAISLTYFVYTIVKLTPTFKSKLIEIFKRHKLTNELLSNYGYRTFMFSIFSFSLNIAYVIFQGIMAFSTLSVWYISITAYYLILSLMKGNIFLSKKKAKDSDEKEAKTLRFSGIMFIFLTLALSGLIVLMYKTNMYFEYAGLMIYVIAAYTFFNLSLAIYNIFKAKKQDSLHIENLRNINLAHAVFSILVLQVALFQAFSPESNKGFANALTGAGVSIIILLLAILMIIKANKTLKTLKEKNNEQIEEKQVWWF